VNSTTSADDRVAAIRAEAARCGEDVAGLTDTELLLRQIDRAWAESRRHENNYSSLLQDQVKRERSARAAARRAAVEDRIAWAGMYLANLVGQSAHDINAVINRAAELPDGRVPVEQARELKAAAERAKWMMSGLVGHRQEQFDKARRQSEGIQLVEKQRDEIWRLRSFVSALGERLHAEQGGSGTRDNGWRCECSGCELIRAMDAVPAEQAAVAVEAVA
jgi:hypothetical protein